MPGPSPIWVLADDRPGNANQALGVAEALGWPFLVKALRYGPLARLPNLLQGASLAGLRGSSRAELQPPWPALVIAAGRRTAPVARWLKRQRPDVFLVQLMWPGAARDLDLVAVPEHDDLPDHPALIRTPGAPHRLTPERLAAAAAGLAPQIVALPRPRIACLVGGANRAGGFRIADARPFALAAGALARASGGSLMLTTSRRTGRACEEALASALPPEIPALLHRFSSGGDNPYLGLLGSADAVVVSGDSASMCTEACATGRPAFVYRPRARIGAKHERLLARLEAEGRLLPLGSPWPETVPPPLSPQAVVAEAIRERLVPPTGRRPGSGG
jgi:uncharacterized protein